MSERLANLGYGALKKETTIGTPVIPNVFFPIYKESLVQEMMVDLDNPVMGVRSNPFAVYPGIREFVGTITVQGEPNTMEYWLDMLFAAGNITGANPYTHPFTEGLSNSYTIEIQKGQVVYRFFGVMADKISPSFNKDKMELEISLAALGVFQVANIASISTVTLTLDQTYQSNPNLGLVAGDLVSVIDPTGVVNTLNTTIAGAGVNANGYQVTLSASAAAFSSGALLVLRGQTPSYSTLTPFLFAKTQLQFGSSLSAAASAAQTNVEEGMKWELQHNFTDKGGSKRSGSFNPASLPRGQTEASLNVKRFFDVPDDLDRYQRTVSQAAIITHYSGATNQYSLVVKLPAVYQQKPKQPLESGKIIYNDIDYKAAYSSGDGYLANATVINAISS
jgi:tail tube protein